MSVDIDEIKRIAFEYGEYRDQGRHDDFALWLRERLEELERHRRWREMHGATE